LSNLLGNLGVVSGGGDGFKTNGTVILFAIVIAILIAYYVGREAQSKQSTQTAPYWG
jgi:hypothetical protein